MNDTAPSDSTGVLESYPPAVIGLGASAGGLNALRAFLSNVPDSLETPIVVVQHMARDHESMLVELLSRVTSRRVVKTVDGAALEPRTVYVQVPGAVTKLDGGTLSVTEAPHVRGTFDFPIDGFFESLAQASGPRGAAVVLSGTGTDGSRGIRRVREAGGLVLVQSPADAEFDGMCQAAIDSGVVDRVDSAERLAGIASQFIEFGRPLDDLGFAPVPLDQMGPIEQVVALLSREGGIDFSVYKPAAIYRRIERRAVIRQCEGVLGYVKLLRDDPDEVASLTREMLISVTRFFRDAEVWDHVAGVLLPRLLAKKDDGDVVRAWVAGCATGEEAYTVAMLLTEAIARSGKQLTAKIFATDVAAVVEAAAVGEYPYAAVADIPAERRARFFDETTNGFRVTPALRNAVVFARHDLTRHAPFTKMDLVTCRNLLIYVRPRYQEHILRALHFSLVRNGHLILGLAESLGSLSSEFVTVQRELQIYRKLRDVRLVTRPLVAATPRAGARTVPVVDRKLEELPGAVIGAWLRQHDGCALVLSQDDELVATYGDVGGVLTFTDGRINTRAPDLLAKHLDVPVMTAVRRTRLSGEIMRLGRIADPKTNESLEIITVPLLGDGVALGTVAVFLGRGDETLRAELLTLTGDDLDTAAARRISELEGELARSLEDQRATIEELEAANEEQQSTNEEVLAANEELQSVNEELQSVNEELQTVNAEFRAKLNEVTELNADLDNLLQSTDIAVVFVDEALRIRKYTPAAETMINLVPRDLGRLLTDISHHLLDVNLGDILREEEPAPRVVHSRDGRSMELRVRPYIRSGRTRGRVLTLYDITAGQETERALTRSRRMLRQALDLLPQEVSVIDASGRVLLVNRTFADHLGADVDSLEGERLPGLDAGEIEAAKLMREVTKVLEAGRPMFVSAEDSIDPQGRPRILQTTRLPLGLDAVERPAVISVASDVTHVRVAEETVRRQSMYDPLTKLPNRLLFSERVQHAVSRLARRESRRSAVLFLDLDRFKEVNDTEGHLAGDQLLLEFAGRLQEALRPGDTVSRFGGDEFAVLLEDVGGTKEVQHVCTRLHTQMAVPFDVGESKHLLSASIGVRLISSPDADVNDILRDADTAMYAAKNGGRGRTTIFSEALAEENNEAVRLRQGMLAGMNEGQFEPWYQPVVRLADGRMCGVESLMRWRRDGEIISPAGFLEQAIAGGFLADLEALLWPRVAADVVAWRDGVGALPPDFYVSINVSAESLGTVDFAPRFLNVFREAGVDTALIAVELTEHSLHARTRIVREHLEALQEAGVRVHLDDFGTGHASLTNLVQFPLDVIKIDRTFVRAHDRARKLAKAAIGIAQDLELAVIAEGVETQESRSFLLDHGVMLAQGFLFARPQPASDLVDLLTRTLLEVEREAGV